MEASLAWKSEDGIPGTILSCCTTWLHSACSDAVHSPLSDLPSEWPGIHLPFLLTSFPARQPAALTALRTWTLTSKFLAGHSLLNSSQMPLPPESQVAGVRSGGRRAGRRMRGGPRMAPAIHSRLSPCRRSLNCFRPPHPHPTFSTRAGGLALEMKPVGETPLGPRHANLWHRCVPAETISFLF